MCVLEFCLPYMGISLTYYLCLLLSIPPGWGALGALPPGSSIHFVCPSSILVTTHTHLPCARSWGLGEKATVVPNPLTQLCILGCMRTKTPVWGTPEQRARGWRAPFA